MPSSQTVVSKRLTYFSVTANLLTSLRDLTGQHAPRLCDTARNMRCATASLSLCKPENKYKTRQRYTEFSTSFIDIVSTTRTVRIDVMLSDIQLACFLNKRSRLNYFTSVKEMLAGSSWLIAMLPRQCGNKYA